MLCLILKLNLTLKKLKLVTINYLIKCLELQFKKKFKRKKIFCLVIKMKSIYLM